MSALSNPKHEAFAQALAKGLKASEAYVEAGYAECSAAATRLSKSVKIRERVDQLLAPAVQAVGVDATRTLAELARIGFSDLRQAFDADGNLLPIADWPEDFARAVAHFEVVVVKGQSTDASAVEHVAKVKLWDKPGALTLIARHLGMLVEQKGKEDDAIVLLRDMILGAVGPQAALPIGKPNLRVVGE